MFGSKIVLIAPISNWKILMMERIGGADNWPDLKFKGVNSEKNISRFMAVFIFTFLGKFIDQKFNLDSDF